MGSIGLDDDGDARVKVWEERHLSGAFEVGRFTVRSVQLFVSDKFCHLPG